MNDFLSFPATLNVGSEALIKKNENQKFFIQVILLMKGQ